MYDIHILLVDVFKDEDDPISPAGVKNQALLESACERPETSLGDFEKYVSLPEKLAALFHSLNKNHPFHNGNKRTALVTFLTALHRNGYYLKTSITDDQIYDLTVSMTADNFPREEHDLPVDDVIQALAS